jgi:hypothetical protein
MRRDWLTLAFGVVLVWVIVALSLRQTWTRPPAEHSRTPDAAPAATAPAAAAAPESVRTPPTEDPSTAASAAAKTKAPDVPAVRSPVAAKPSGTEAGMAVLQVVSDVPGASVFLDREFVGATPLTLRGLVPGPKQLNVTATGHDGYSATIAVTDGPNKVSVEFLKVHLSAAVPVIHRHAMGSCQGTLTASPKGLSYDASNKTDAFALAFSDVDEFDVDYLKKNLRVRRRAGKTWNFTNDSADALFTFHRDVSKAREKLAATR